MTSQFYLTSKVSLNHLQEFSTITASEPPPDWLRPYNRNLRLQIKTSIRSDCTWNYIGETGRCLHNRKKEHIRNTKVFKSGSNVASHAWLEGHTIDFENARVIDRGNSRVRKTLESWHTAVTSQADNDIILSSCLDNTQLYCNLIHHKYFFCITVFIHIRLFFSHLFVHTGTYFYLRFLHLTF